MLISSDLLLSLRPSMQAPIIKSPLGIIALFVALIEAFLSYPLTLLTAADRTILVVFMTLFPSFVAAAFFVILWHRPSHLYNPQEIPIDLQDRYQQNIKKQVTETTILEEQLKESHEQIASLKRSISESEKQNITINMRNFEENVSSSRSIKEAVQNVHSDLDSIKSKISSQVGAPTITNYESIQDVKNEAKEIYDRFKRGKVQECRYEIEKFRSWLKDKGFMHLPNIPEINISTSTTGFVLYDPTTHAIHIDSNGYDRDLLSYLYFLAVVDEIAKSKRIDLGKIKGQDYYIVQVGTALYYVGSYIGSPVMTKSLAIYGFDINLEAIERFDVEEKTSKIAWATACWALREDINPAIVDQAIYAALVKMPANASISQLANILTNEVVSRTDERVRDHIQSVFNKRGLQLN